MSILDHVISLTAQRLGRTVVPEAVPVDHFDRVVFRCTDPFLGEVAIKAQTKVSDLAVELAGMRAAEAAGVPVPKILAHFTEAEIAIVVTSWIDGDPLGPDSPDADWRTAGEVLRRLHDHPPSEDLPTLFGGGDEGRHILDGPGPVGALPVEIRTRLGELSDLAFTAPQTPGRLLHGDFSPYHLLLRDGRVTGVVDFGLARSGNPVWDLAMLTLWHHDRLPPVLDGYAATPEFRDEVARYRDPFTVAHHLGAYQWLVDRGRDPRPTVTELTRIATASNTRTTN